MIDVDAVRARLSDPTELAHLLGLEIGRTKQRDGVLVRCPAHADKTPSMSLRVAADRTLSAYCFTCHFSADAIGLVGKMLGLRGREMLVRAAELAGVSTEDAPSSRERPRSQPTIPNRIRVAMAIDRVGDDWLAGREVRPEPLIEQASDDDLDAAFDICLVRVGNAIVRQRRLNDELERLADAYDIERSWGL